MRTGPDHERWADAAGAYVLQALEPGERDAFEAHLGGCPACRHEVDELRVAAEALPASTEQLAPPPELKTRIMAVVQAEAEMLQAARPPAQRPRGRGPFAWLSPRPALALAATLLVLAAGGLAGWALRSGEGDVRRTVLAEVRAPGAQARLLVRDDHSTLVAQDLPAPGTGRVYQVWLKRPGRDPEPTDALFDVRRDGSASVDVPGSLEGVEAVLVTSEPKGGSVVPTRAPVITAVPA